MMLRGLTTLMTAMTCVGLLLLHSSPARACHETFSSPYDCFCNQPTLDTLIGHFVAVEDGYTFVVDESFSSSVPATFVPGDHVSFDPFVSFDSGVEYLAFHLPFGWAIQPVMDDGTILLLGPTGASEELLRSCTQPQDASDVARVTVSWGNGRTCAEAVDEFLTLEPAPDDCTSADSGCAGGAGDVHAWLFGVAMLLRASWRPNR